MEASQNQEQVAEPRGRVLSVDGSQAMVRLNITSRDHAPQEAQATVGKFLAIRTGTSYLVGVITKISTPTPHAATSSARMRSASSISSARSSGTKPARSTSSAASPSIR